MQMRPRNLPLSTVWIGLGTNLGNREANLDVAIRALEQLPFADPTYSKRYETRPWGVTDQPSFINQVVRYNTPFGPFSILIALQKIEQQMGRQKTRKWGERIIDLDILLYNNIQMKSQRLIIPHPYMHERIFVMEPLSEINPEGIIPGFTQTNKELAQIIGK